MSRCINEDEILKRQKDVILFNGAKHRCFDTTELAEVPTADVREVVLCKDCKYWQDNNDGYPHEECRWGHEETPNEDDYCSYGERRT